HSPMVALYEAARGTALARLLVDVAALLAVRFEHRARARARDALRRLRRRRARPFRLRPLLLLERGDVHAKRALREHQSVTIGNGMARQLTGPFNQLLELVVDREHASRAVRLL